MYYVHYNRTPIRGCPVLRTPCIIRTPWLARIAILESGHHTLPLVIEPYPVHWHTSY